jgi:hypothetical protein
VRGDGRCGDCNCRSGFVAGTTDSALGKCDSIIGLGFETGRVSWDECCPEWVRGNTGNNLGRGTRGAANWGARHLRSWRGTKGRTSVMEKRIAMFGKDRDMERHFDLSQVDA